MTIGRTTQWRLPYWLALFAVLVQLIASFGHLHPEDYNFLLTGHHATVVSTDTGPWHNSSAAIAPDTDCAICASAMLLGSSALPDAFVLPAPSVTASAQPTTGDELRLTPPPHSLFSTRAPPSL